MCNKVFNTLTPKFPLWHLEAWRQKQLRGFASQTFQLLLQCHHDLLHHMHLSTSLPHRWDKVIFERQVNKAYSFTLYNYKVMSKKWAWFWYNQYIDSTFFSYVRGCWEQYNWWQRSKAPFQTLHGITPVSRTPFMWWDVNPRGLCSLHSWLLNHMQTFEVNFPLWNQSSA